MRDATIARGLQDRAARALPAEQVETTAQGWWLRYAPGCSWWIGTVLPHGEVRSHGQGPDVEPGTDALAHRVAAAERFYADRGSVTRFQITPGVCPAELDALLAARGYARASPMSLQAASVADAAAGGKPDPTDVRLEQSPTDAWLGAWRAIHGDDADHRAEYALFRRVPPPTAYASVLLGGEPVAIGRAVLDTGKAGVFGMATLPRARGRGAARRILAALAGWAGDRGADGMYLQVERGNTAAWRLYERAGFREVCGYHYRVAG